MRKPWMIPSTRNCRRPNSSIALVRFGWVELVMLCTASLLRLSWPSMLTIRIRPMHSFVVEAFAALHVNDPYLPYATMIDGSGEAKAASDKADGASDVSTCTAGFSHEEKLAMEARCSKLLDQATKLSEFLKDRDSVIVSLRAELESHKKTIKDLEAQATPATAPEESSVVKFQDLDEKQKDAARAKLRRFCQRKADGTLNVPLEVHNQWKEAGSGRDRLLQLFVGVNFDRDPLLQSLELSR